MPETPQMPMVGIGFIGWSGVLHVRSAAEQIIDHVSTIAFAFGELKTVLLTFVSVVINLQKDAIKFLLAVVRESHPRLEVNYRRTTPRNAELLMGFHFL